MITQSRILRVLILIVALEISCLAQNAKSTQTGEELKAKLSVIQRKNAAITLKLKPGSVYYYLSRNEDVKHVAEDKNKLTGTIAVAAGDYFILNERWFLGQSGELKIRYEDVEKVKVNAIPNGLKTTGEVLFYCILLMPTGACAK
jgi:hypothetical protein